MVPPSPKHIHFFFFSSSTNSTKYPSCAKPRVGHRDVGQGFSFVTRWMFCTDYFLSRGPVLCFIGYIAASYGFYHEMPVATPLKVVTTKDVPRHRQVHLRGTQSSTVRSHPSRRTNTSPSLRAWLWFVRSAGPPTVQCKTGDAKDTSFSGGCPELAS